MRLGVPGVVQQEPEPVQPQYPGRVTEYLRVPGPYHGEVQEFERDQDRVVPVQRLDEPV